MSIKYTRHARDTNSVYLDAASTTQEEYIRGKPTAVKPTKSKLMRITRKNAGHVQFPHVVGSLVVPSDS